MAFLLFSPESKFKLVWSFVLTFLILYAAFVSPIRLAFLEDEAAPKWWQVRLLVDILFGIYILMMKANLFVNVGR